MITFKKKILIGGGWCKLQNKCKFKLDWRDESSINNIFLKVTSHKEKMLSQPLVGF